MNDRPIDVEDWPRSGAGNLVRATVLGANDGLVSNLSLVMGVSGAALAGSQVLVTGIAGLLAGSLSMALGEWISVQSAREHHLRRLQEEHAEIKNEPERERLELVALYQKKGLTEKEATVLAERLMKRPDKVLELMAYEELGINPSDLGGSPWSAAFGSFGAFCIGAIIPVLPFFFHSKDFNPIPISIGLSSMGLFALGGTISLYTHRSFTFAGVRQMAFGLLAAMLTYFVGSLIGVQMS